MRTPQGCAFICEEGRTREIDTFTCFHCNRVVHLPTGKQVEQVGDFCRQCMKLICDKCAGNGCTPFLKKLELFEARYNARRQYEMLAGL